MTRGSGAVIERSFVASDAHYAHTFSLVVGSDQGEAGLADPILTEPIDYAAELAERAKRDRLPPVETDLANDLFGI